MSLTALAYTKHLTGAPAANTVAGWLDAIYAALNGNMTHWTVARYQNGGATECVYFTPKAGQALTKNVRIMLAGADSGSLTPTMGLNATFANAKLFMGLVIGAGAFATWDAASPFTSHDYRSGLMPIGACASIAATGFYVYESAETLFVLPMIATGPRSGGIAGALFDPESAVAANVSATGDERVYALLAGGDSMTGWGSLHFLGEDSYFGAHSASAAAVKAVYLNAAGSWAALELGPKLQDGNLTLLQPDGSPWLYTVFGFQGAASYRMLGRLREIYIGPRDGHDTNINDANGNLYAHSVGDTGQGPLLCIRAA